MGKNKTTEHIYGVVGARGDEDDRVVDVEHISQDGHQVEFVVVEFKRESKHQTDVTAVEEIPAAVGDEERGHLRLVPEVGLGDTHAEEGLV